MMAVPDGLRPRKGAASSPACTLGLDDERNWTLLAWVTSPRLGSRATAASTSAIQTATITQRNRTSNRAMLVNIAVLPCGQRHASESLPDQSRPAQGYMGSSPASAP